MFPVTCFLPCDDGQIGRVETRPHEECDVFMSNHTKYGHFVQEGIHILNMAPCVDQNFPVPITPESNKLEINIIQVTSI